MFTKEGEKAKNDQRSASKKENSSNSSSQGGRGWLAFGERKEIPLSFRSERFWKILQAGSSKALWELSESSLKTQQKLSESRISERSTNIILKQALQ